MNSFFSFLLRGRKIFCGSDLFPSGAAYPNCQASPSSYYVPEGEDSAIGPFAGDIGPFPPGRDLSIFPSGVPGASVFPEAAISILDSSCRVSLFPPESMSRNFWRKGLEQGCFSRIFAPVGDKPGNGLTGKFRFCGKLSGEYSISGSPGKRRKKEQGSKAAL
jgi:hypothetical protein